MCGWVKIKNFFRFKSIYAESFIDNVDLINSTIDWIDSNPLGSAAGYGVGIPLNRKQITKDLGFKRTQLNSLYIQNSRGKYEMQVLNTVKQSMLDIRKFAWDMSLFLSQEFDLLNIDEIYQTGSSIMPQKKNPDVCELTRGKTGRLYGNLTSILTSIKGLPLTYNRDLQEDKEPLFDSIDTLTLALKVNTEMISEMEINEDACAAAAHA